MKIPANTEPFLYGAIAGAIALAIIGFNWGGWLTTSSAEQFARMRSDQAAVKLLAPICVAQFQKAPDAKENLSELMAKDRWEQADYVRNGGWSTMPGSTGEANRGVAEACAKTLARREV